MIIDHTVFAVSDVARSHAFYAAALAPLGLGLIAEYDGWAGFGRDGHAAFWVNAAGARPIVPDGTIHIAFAARTRDAVDAFHQAALAAGGRDNGAPGLRARYHPDYYGAFVLDPDGYNIEAVCHAP